MSQPILGENNNLKPENRNQFQAGWKAYFISDIHLRTADEPNARILEKFLDDTKADPFVSHVILLGDIFDLWIGAHSCFVAQFKDIIFKVRALVDRGIQVIYLEGNHDLYLDHYWLQYGVQVYSEPLLIQIGSKKIRIEHGDLIDQDDHGYLFLRRVLRNSWVRSVALNLPSGVVDPLGKYFSRLSRSQTTRVGHEWEDTIREKLRSYARRLREQQEFDFIVSGHLHIQDEYRFSRDKKDCWSINTGSWFSRPTYYLISDISHRFVEL